MEHLALPRNTLFPLPRLIFPLVSDPVVEIWEKSLSKFKFNTKYAGGVNCFSIHANLVW